MDDLSVDSLLERCNFPQENTVVDCAVSGGPDSLALSCLSKLYSEETQKYFECIIIDHGVRKDSDKEAKKVKQLLSKKKIKSDIFKIKFTEAGNFHSTARKKRYDLILKFCKKKQKMRLKILF